MKHLVQNVMGFVAVGRSGTVGSCHGGSEECCCVPCIHVETQLHLKAFIYYTDDSITDASGERFLQSAVLIKLEWLISASIDPQISGDVVMGFPEKTLVARVGAITIDSKFTFNEDDEEQESEVVQVVRPFGHTPDKAVSTDITLLKTLLPFTSTAAVAIANINMLPSLSSCSILVFVQTKGNSEEKSLIEIPVEMHKSKEQCGPDFKEGLMACGDDSEQSKAIIDENHYCHGNAGGPLICGGEVVGIQSYINQVCHQPHLFNLFSGWRTFINCGIEKGCKDNCHNVCRSVHKDKSTETTELTSYIYSEAVESTDLANVTAESVNTATIELTTSPATEATPPSTPAPTNATKTTTITTESTPTTSTATTTTIPTNHITTKNTSTSTSTSVTPSTVMTIPESTTPPSTPGRKQHKEEAESVVDVITRPDANVRKPKIESFSAVKKEPKIDDMTGRRKNAMNSSSARYLNGLLIIFLNLVVAI